jgi:hypothetical protein
VTYLLIAFLMLVCFVLGWQARDIRQDRIEAAEYYEEYERPCDHVSETHGACEARGRHFMHSKWGGKVGWTGMWQAGNPTAKDRRSDDV